MTTATLAPLHMPVTARSRLPTLQHLAALEIRKTLTTRSGRWIAGVAALAPAIALAALAAFGETAGSVAEVLGVMGLLVAMLMLTLGALSTAGEWTHRTVQTTFLAVPGRNRVTAAKYVAAMVLGLTITAFVIATTLAVAALTAASGFAWAGAGVAIAATLAAGSAFAIIGAGIGAAVANAPAALAGSYVTILIALPLLRGVAPDVFNYIDPINATINLVDQRHVATSVAVLTGWVVITTVGGAAVTRRKALA
jgi:ABC-2 type transport system permease protein